MHSSGQPWKPGEEKIFFLQKHELFSRKKVTILSELLKDDRALGLKIIGGRHGEVQGRSMHAHAQLLLSDSQTRQAAYERKRYKHEQSNL